MVDIPRAETRMVEGFLLWGFTTGRWKRESGKPDGLLDRLGVRGGLGQHLMLLTVEFQGDQPHGAQRRQGGVERHLQAGVAEAILQRRAQQQRQMGHKQVPPDPRLGLVIDGPHGCHILEAAEGAFHRLQLFVGGCRLEGIEGRIVGLQQVGAFHASFGAERDSCQTRARRACQTLRLAVCEFGLML
ncbi:MAG: hypothetical protein QME77_00780 [bacterium]|nr:hypothetical protein [bacterium]